MLRPRPDEKKFLEENKKLPEAIAARQTDAQGTSEDSSRAEEEQALPWVPTLKPGKYTLKTRRVFDLNCHNY